MKRHLWALVLALLLAWATPMPAQAQEEPIRQVHIADGSKTLGQVARAYGVPLRDLARVNGLVPDEPLETGMRLRLPEPQRPTRPSVGIVLTPTVPAQGDTLAFQVVADAPFASLAASLDGLPVAVDVRGRGLAGVHPLATPGEHLLHVRIADEGGWITEFVWPVRVRGRAFDEQHITLSAQTSALLAPELVQEERRKLSAIWGDITGEPLWSGPFVHPLTTPLTLTTGFGTRRTYNDGRLYGFHEGLDYAAPSGTPVYAAADGRVVLAEALMVRGNSVIIGHGMGVMSGYWHLSRIGVKVGQMVRQGDVIGWVGTTGLSTGPHLHWEVRVAGVPVDPRPWVERGFP